jgi:hypothetical protein
MEFSIPLNPSTFRSYYPDVTPTVVATTPKIKYAVTLQDPAGSLHGELDGWASDLKNENTNYTTCCIQMSHAINMAFHLVDATKMVGLRSTRLRPTHAAAIAAAANKNFHYIASVDEMKGFLTDQFGEGEEISHTAFGKAATPAQSKSFIQDQPGILVFMGTSPWGVHTEIWTGNDFNQNWIRGQTYPFGPGWAPVWFWSMGLPTVPIV